MVLDFTSQNWNTVLPNIQHPVSSHLRGINLFCNPVDLLTMYKTIVIVKKKN